MEIDKTEQSTDVEVIVNTDHACKTIVGFQSDFFHFMKLHNYLKTFECLTRNVPTVEIKTIQRTKRKRLFKNEGFRPLFNFEIEILDGTVEQMKNIIHEKITTQGMAWPGDGGLMERTLIILPPGTRAD